jgi:hypothetical protein
MGWNIYVQNHLVSRVTEVKKKKTSMQLSHVTGIITPYLSTDLAQFHGTLFGFHPMALSVFTFPTSLN